MTSRFLSVITGLALSCSTACHAPEKPAATSGKPRVAFVLKTLNSPFFIEMQKGAVEAAAKQNVDLVIQAAEREVDAEKQMQIVENLLQTGIKVLLITPSGSREIVAVLAKVNAAGIPIVVIDDRIDADVAAKAGVKIASYVGSDNVEGGRVAGRALVEMSGGKANVALLEGIAGHETGDSRLRGFKEAIKDSPGIKVVASQTANWERDQGFTVFQNMMEAHPEIDAIFACNDIMALGATEAIAAAGKTGKIRVIGFDAVDDARKAIEAGTMAASVAQLPSEMGRIAVESAAKLIKGEQIPAEQLVRIELVKKAPPAK
ncbi:MAG: sugar ABC transporter substrate-binding protein [Vicinamibacteria bacterium]